MNIDQLAPERCGAVSQLLHNNSKTSNLPAIIINHTVITFEHFVDSSKERNENYLPSMLTKRDGSLTPPGGYETLWDFPVRTTTRIPPCSQESPGGSGSRFWRRYA